MWDPSKPMSSVAEIVQFLCPYAFETSADLQTRIIQNEILFTNILAKKETTKERTKELKTIAGKLNIFPVNRHNDDLLLIEAITVVKLYFQEEGQQQLVGFEKFQEEYPEFHSVPAGELNVLYHYRNLMGVATRVVPALWNYNHLIDLVARIGEGMKRMDGSLVRYVTGSGAKESTLQRVAIYERVGGVQKKKRPPRVFDFIKSALDNLHDGSELRSSTNSDENNRTISLGRQTLPVREWSCPLDEDRGLMVNTQVADTKQGLTIRTQSLSKTSLDRSASELMRSASLTSRGASALDEVQLFADLHDDNAGFSFLDSPELRNYTYTNESMYKPDGEVYHHVGVVEKIDSHDNLLGVDDNIAHQFPLHPQSSVPTLSTSQPAPDTPADFSLGPPLIFQSGYGISGSSSSSSKIPEDNLAGQKRKVEESATSAVKDVVKKPRTPAQQERYDILISKLLSFSFDKTNTYSTLKGDKSMSNKEFIRTHIQENLDEFEHLVRTLDKSPKAAEKSIKKFAAGLGVDPISWKNQAYLIVEATVVLLLSSREQWQHLKTTTDEFKEAFPDLAFLEEEDKEEFEKLHNFRDMMAATVMIMSPKSHQNHCMDLVTKLTEGFSVKYHTGGGETKNTTRRKDIFKSFLDGADQRREFWSAAVHDVKSVDSLASPASGGGHSSSNVLQRFQETLNAPKLDLQTKESSYVHPDLPALTVNIKEVSTADASISCRSTSVSRKGTDAVTGTPFSLELARGISITSAGGFELFENFDLGQSRDDSDSGEGEDDHNGFITLLQDNCSPSDGVQMHRTTSGTHQGVMRTISLTRHISGDVVMPDIHGNEVEVTSLARDNSLRAQV